jgi:hypothetical protein
MPEGRWRHADNGKNSDGSRPTILHGAVKVVVGRRAPDCCLPGTDLPWTSPVTKSYRQFEQCPMTSNA